jgi:hypothetical protein
MSSISRFQLRHDQAAIWTSVNPILLDGEVGIESDTRSFKVGNGVSSWNDLPYYLNLSAARGQASRSTTGTITNLTQGVYKVTGLSATFDSASALGTTLGTTDLFGIKNTSGSAQLMQVFATIDATAGNNQVLGLKLAKNGTAIDQSECRAFAASSGNEAQLVTTWMINMAINDEVSIMVANHSANHDISLKRGRIVLSEVH